MKHRLLFLVVTSMPGLLMSADAGAAKSNAVRWLDAVKTPDFAVPATWNDWAAKRAGIRATLWSLLGDLPPRPAKPETRVLSREDGDGFVLEKFEFDNGAGAMVPGYLFLPKTAEGKVPAILYCHWHGGQYDNGKEELLGNKDIPARPGPTLARLGYAVLGIDAYCFGGRNGQGPGGEGEKGSGGELTAAKFQLWAGRSLWGMMMRDDLMALDYLCSRPEVDAGRVGVTGMSMGSTRAWWIMALDDRPKAAVCVGCMTRYRELIRNERLRAHGIYYFVPGMLRHFDSEAVIALAAPRPMLFLTGDQDIGSPLEGVKILESKVRPVYELAGKAGNFESVIYPDTGHVYTSDMWNRMVKWMDARVKQ